MISYLEFLGAVSAIVFVFRELGLAATDLQQVEQWVDDLRREEKVTAWEALSHAAQQTVLDNLKTAHTLAGQGELLVIGVVLDDRPLAVEVPWLRLHRAGGARFALASPTDRRARDMDLTIFHTHLCWTVLKDAVDRIVNRLRADADLSCHPAIDAWRYALLYHRDHGQQWWKDQRAERRQAAMINLQRVLDWVKAGATPLPDADWILHATVPPVPVDYAQHPVEPADGPVPAGGLPHRPLAQDGQGAHDWADGHGGQGGQEHLGAEHFTFVSSPHVSPIVALQGGDFPYWPERRPHAPEAGASGGR
ncbi:hypothetical protein JCM10449v2_000674 [Rhodotorula kratochvilovae]